MSKSIQRTLEAFGLTPWQALALIAAASFYVGEMRPKLAAGDKVAVAVEDLNKTLDRMLKEK